MRFIMSYYYDMYINQNTPYIDLPWYMTLIRFLCPKEITYDLQGLSIKMYFLKLKF